jgi:N-acetylmuramoyl-L-alanine amidase
VAAISLIVLAATGVVSAETRPGRASAPVENAAVATDARLAGDESRTRFIVDLSASVELAAFTLADPYRVVIDLPQVGFAFPAKTGVSGRGLIKAFRFGLVMPGGSRIVIDTTGPVRIDKAVVLDPLEGQPARLVLDLVTVDRESFLRELGSERQPRRQAAPTRKSEREAAPGDMRPVVVLDAGHGGVDSGTTAPGGESEKTIVLEFAQHLAEKLEKAGKYRVVMTRTDDSFVALGERVRIARANNAALFISIHADSLATRNTEIRGATVYTLSETASDAEAARLAESENKADAVAGLDLTEEPEHVADILIDLAQRETKTFTHQFARGLIKQMRSAAKMHRNPLRSAGFKVLKAPDVPSVLVELGYVSSPEDLKLMTSDAWRRRTSDAIIAAVNTFFATRLARNAGAAGAN